MPPAPLASRLARLLKLGPGEAPAVFAGMAMFFLLFTGYALLRPVRDTMGIAGGVDNLQWLFTATFVVMLVAIPMFGWVAARAARRRIQLWTYSFFALNLAGFAALFVMDPDNVWAGRTFYVWLSVFNLIVISVAWSVLADIFSMSQAKRVFALMAAGMSAGGLAGPSLSVALVEPLGFAGLMLLSAGFLMGSAGFAFHLQRWRDRQPLRPGEDPARRSPLGGNPFAGIGTVLRSPFLLGIASFVVLLASVTTFLYFEQARLIELHFPDPVRQTQVFSYLDITVQSLTIITQLFFTARIAQRLGVVVLLAAVPVVMALGFLWLALAPTFAVFAAVMVFRRAGGYALARPGREMLFTVVAPDAKYKAKNVIDTAVYRGADAVSGWVKTGIDAVAGNPAAVYVAGALLALAWAWTGVSLGRAQQRMAAGDERPGG